MNSYQIVDNGDNSFNFTENGDLTIIQKLEVDYLKVSKSIGVFIVLRNGAVFKIDNYTEETELNSTSAPDLADKINTIVNNTSGGESFTCTDVGACVNSSPASADASGNAKIAVYDTINSRLAHVTTANFFTGILTAVANLFVSKSALIPFDPTFDGIKTVINIPHGLAGTPTFYSVSFTKGPTTDAALGNYTIAVSSTNVTITFAAPPQAATPFGPTLIMLTVK